MACGGRAQGAGSGWSTSGQGGAGGRVFWLLLARTLFPACHPPVLVYHLSVELSWRPRNGDAGVVGERRRGAGGFPAPGLSNFFTKPYLTYLPKESTAEPTVCVAGFSAGLSSLSAFNSQSAELVRSPVKRREGTAPPHP